METPLMTTEELTRRSLEIRIAAPHSACREPSPFFPLPEIYQQTNTWCMIRKARKEDIQHIIALLHQVNMVHHEIRPDLFKPHTTKYNEQELEAMLTDDSKPIFVFDDNMVLGYAFCQLSEVVNHQLLEDIKTLYIDDICVDENARGKHVGKALYEFVRDYAKSIGCNNITLNVWEGNEPAQLFYRSMGMQVQKTTMEINNLNK